MEKEEKLLDKIKEESDATELPKAYLDPTHLIE